MSEFSQALSTCSRTTDFSFVFNNSAFSDAVLVLLTLRPKGVSIPWRLASSVAQLFVSAVEVSATTLTNTVTVGDSWYAAGKALGSLGQTVVSRLSPKDCQEVAIATVYQVNSALLAASSPYLRHLIQHPPQLQHLVPGLASVVSRHKQRKLVTVLIQPHHVSAAEAVVKFIFTNDIALTSAQQALDALLVAEQLQVPDCAEVCQHYLEDCQMDWPVALTLVHLQHKHQQEQQHQRQQKWQQQQQQQQQHGGGGPHKGSSGSSVVTGRRSGPRGSLQRNSMGSGLLRGGRGGSGGPVNSLDAVAPLLPVPSESVYLQGLLLRAQDFLVDQFEDLEVVLGSAEGRQRLLLLPYDALRAILGHPRLQVASENTALLAAAAWLHANAAQVSSLLLSPNSSAAAAAAAAAAGGGGLGLRQSSGGADAPVRSQSVYSSALYSSSNGRAGEDPGSSNSSIAAAHTGANSNSTEGMQNGVLHNTAAAAATQQQQQPPTASGVGSLLLDLCQVLRVCQCSYTYVMHILPHLPLFREEPQLVSALQFEVLRFRAAGKLRQRRLAAEAAAAAAAAAAAGSNSSGLTGHHLAGLEQQQQQQQQGLGVGVGAVSTKAPAGGTGSDSSSTELAKAPAANGVLGGVKPVGGVSGGGAQGWRSGCTADAALLQCQLRPESARSTLDFSFTFDPQALQAGSKGQGGGKGGSAAGAVAGSNGGSSGSSAGVDLMQRLLGLAATQQQDATLVSEDQYFAGYVWNMVVAQDGFVGVSWRVVLPGGVDVPLTAPQAAQQQQVAAGAAVGSPEGWGAAGSYQGLNYSSVRVFGPDCAGFRTPEVAVTFSITSSGLGRGQRNSSSSGSLATAAAGGSTAAAAAATGTAGGAAAAAVKPGSKADQSLPHTGYVNSSSTGNGKGNQQHEQQQGGGNMVSGSPLKGGKVVGRAYSEVQFVPAHCAWGFPDFADPGGWDALKGPDGKVCLRCQLRHRE